MQEKNKEIIQEILQLREEINSRINKMLEEDFSSQDLYLDDVELLETSLCNIMDGHFKTMKNSCGTKEIKKPKVKETKAQLLDQFEVCLHDFWGEEPTRRKIAEAWEDFITAVAEDEEVPKEYYKLTMDEKRKLYEVAGV